MTSSQDVELILRSIEKLIEVEKERNALIQIEKEMIDENARQSRALQARQIDLYAANLARLAPKSEPVVQRLEITTDDNQSPPSPIGEKNGLPDAFVPDGTRYALHEVSPGQRFRHYRGGLYKLLVVARESTNGPREGDACIVYQSMAYPSQIYVRDADEFLDGRFKKVTST